MNRHDLHSHTTFSDGVLTTDELISRAVEKGVEVLSITDHDTVDAYLHDFDNRPDIRLVPGIELSTQWENTGIHILGLGIDPHCGAMKEATQFQSNARFGRARQIGENLRKKGIDGAFEGAAALSVSSYIGRPHFAQHLINIGRVDSMEAAFRKFLGDGKAGDVRQHWAKLTTVVQWIRDAGGIPVLAHPLKYKLTRTKLKRLLDHFIHLGGQGMEVVSGQQQPQMTAEMARLCEDKKLLASCGSDFHMPGKSWAELGVFAPLPRHLTPVWDRF